ncbi:MAG: hypothetical protein BWY75_03058 [bacterium ADurb.Bin425]|nr:MAG: hypothetical protein BWY75_03058 [bacterium ADurb.Bin425]
MGFLSRNERAHLSQNCNESHLAQITTFTGHIWSGQDNQLLLVAGAGQMHVIGHILAHGQKFFEHRVSALLYFQTKRVVDTRASKLALLSHLRQRKQNIEIG